MAESLRLMPMMRCSTGVFLLLHCEGLAACTGGFVRSSTAGLFHVAVVMALGRLAEPGFLRFTVEEGRIGEGSQGQKLLSLSSIISLSHLPLKKQQTRMTATQDEVRIHETTCRESKNNKQKKFEKKKTILKTFFKKKINLKGQPPTPPPPPTEPTSSSDSN